MPGLFRKLVNQFFRYRQQSRSGLSWTGERLVPGVHGSTLILHLHRYALARQLAAGKEVLDIACGEGYGSQMLAEVASRVVGVDISVEAISHARDKYRRPNLEFREGDCGAIPMESHAVDLVSSFETIEHVMEQERLMAELKRVLRPGGLLLISSPDKQQELAAPGWKNPFHLKELEAEEFEALLKKYFAHVVLFGQTTRLASLIWNHQTGPAPIDRFHEGTFESLRSPATPGRPDHWIALCSDAELPPLNPGLFLDQPELKRMERAADILNSMGLLD